MIPKVGDIVRLNPAGMGKLKGVTGWDWGGRSKCVKQIILSADDPDYLSICLDDGKSVGIYKPDGRFYRNPKGSPPLFLAREPEPRNNDGRKTCFWCCTVEGDPIPTEKRGMGAYDVCPNCKR